jgi:hypothetical protein
VPAAPSGSRPAVAAPLQPPPAQQSPFAAAGLIGPLHVSTWHACNAHVSAFAMNYTTFDAVAEKGPFGLGRDHCRKGGTLVSACAQEPLCTMCSNSCECGIQESERLEAKHMERIVQGTGHLCFTAISLFCSWLLALTRFRAFETVLSSSRKASTCRSFF